MKYLMLILSLAIGILLTADAAAAAEYYVWVDENGVTNYAERTPQGVDAQHVTQNQRFGYRANRPEPKGTTPGEDPDAAGENSTDGGVDPDALIAEETARLTAEIATIKRRNCDIGKENLASLLAFARIRVSDEKGENRVLSDAEKQERIARARKTISENCSG